MHVTCSKYRKELSRSVTSVNIELLHRVILYVTYSQYMKRLSMTLSNVNIELLTRVILHVTYSQYMKELSMSVASVTMELLGRIFFILLELSIIFCALTCISSFVTRVTSVQC